MHEFAIPVVHSQVSHSLMGNQQDDEILLR